MLVQIGSKIYNSEKSKMMAICLSDEEYEMLKDSKGCFCAYDDKKFKPAEIQEVMENLLVKAKVFHKVPEAQEEKPEE